MKNRNKRFTSVVAASMALAAIAPVAPVFQTAVFAEDEGTESTAFVPVDLTDGTFSYTVTSVEDKTITLTSINVSKLGSVDAVVDSTYTLDDDDVASILADNPSAEVSVGDVYTINKIGNGTSVVTNGYLDTLTINASAEIAANAFANQKNLTTVKLPNITGIADATTSAEGAFANCESLSGVTLGGSCATIGAYAFYQDAALTTISIPSGVNFINEGAFQGTSIVGTIQMPTSVYSIGANAFATVNQKKALSIVLPASENKYDGFYCKYLGVDPTGFNETTGLPIYSDDEGGCIFGTTTGYDTYYQISGSLTTLDGNVLSGVDANEAYYNAAPKITLGTSKTTATSTTLSATVGDNVWVRTTELGTITVTKDGEPYATYSITSKSNTVSVTGDDGSTTVYYVQKITTPQVGEYNVVAQNEAGFYSSDVTFTVSTAKPTQQSNSWTNQNLTCGNISLGETPQPSGLAAKYGDVVYEYTQNPYNSSSWSTDIPNKVGTWYVRGVVEATDTYKGLVSTTSDIMAKFAVTEAVAPEHVSEWVENEDGTWTYYDEAGKTLADGIHTLPIANDSEETADFWFVDGVMQKGWYTSNSDKQHYFSTVSGAMLKNRWVSVDADGNYVDWKTNPEAVAAYYYVDAEGNVVKDVFKYDEACTYGEGEADGHYYAFAADGAMETGWVENGGKKYYFAPRTGIMLQSRWAEIGGNWYYFYEDGAMATDTIIDGMYKVDADGVWDGVTL